MNIEISKFNPDKVSESPKVEKRASNSQINTMIGSLVASGTGKYKNLDQKDDNSEVISE